MSGKQKSSNCSGKVYLIVLAPRRFGLEAGALLKCGRVRSEPGSSAVNWNLSVTGGILMEKGSGTVSDKHDVKEPRTRQQPPHAKLPQFEEWHPSRIKTGLRNRRIGKKVSARVRKKA